MLCKVREALRTNGSVLIIQPAPVNTIIEVKIEGNIEFSEELMEPNFHQYLAATRASINNVVGKQLFVVEDEATTPDEGFYLCNEYGSLDEWIEDHKPSCEDMAALEAMSANIRNITSGREHRILKLWREYKVLLRKSRPR